ncbi:uncharacterized protein [Mytilus edulis]|uniref:uncharacterized protein n=1 Tax=Mytilus edulis TaxID=6550 RepID=UPI0039EF307F
MRLYVTLCLVIIGVFAADIQKSGPISSQKCFQPMERKIQELVEVRHTGVYPTAAIKRTISRSTSTQKLQLQKAIAFGNSYCQRYRIRTADVKPAAKLVSTRLNFWSNTCPSYTRYYYFPRAVRYGGQTCWVLSNWHNLRCKQTACIYRSCSGVYTFWPWMTACRHTSYKAHYYYIWCPRFGLVRRYVRLPQCCSCMKLLCRPWVQPISKAG